MKKMLGSLFAMSALAVVASGAHAASPEIRKPVWDCALTFDARGGGFQFFVGDFKLSGPGLIRCMDVAGNSEVIPVTVQLGGRPLAARIAVAPDLELKGVATGIGLNDRPESILGQYLVASADGAFGIFGGGAVVGVHGAQNALDFDLSLQYARGLGIQAGFSSLQILPRNPAPATQGS